MHTLILLPYILYKQPDLDAQPAGKQQQKNRIIGYADRFGNKKLRISPQAGSADRCLRMGLSVQSLRAA